MLILLTVPGITNVGEALLLYEHVVMDSIGARRLPVATTQKMWIASVYTYLVFVLQFQPVTGARFLKRSYL